MTLLYYNYNNRAWAEDEAQSAFSLPIREDGRDETLLAALPVPFSRETRRGSLFIYPFQTPTNWMQKDLFWKGLALPHPPTPSRGQG